MRHALARLALEIAPAHDGFELDLDLGNAVVDEAAVDFDLRFAGAADEAEAAALALEMGPAPHQAAALIREMRELDLETALARARAGAEDLEDQRRAVDDLAAPRLLEVALLRRRDRAVEHDEADIVRLHRLGDAQDGAFADVGRRHELRDAHGFLAEHCQLDRGRKAHRLIQPRLGASHRRRIAA